MRVLVVEDERKVADALRDGLEAEQYEVVIERTGEGGLVRSTTEAFDVVVLDLGLPGRDGLDILAAIRKNGNQVPVIVLTARDTVPARVAGLDAGADHYLVKPFAFAELLARIRALVRPGWAADSFLPLPRSILRGGVLTGADSFFSPDYKTARSRIREAAGRLGCEIQAHPIDGTGPHGEDLTIDVVITRGTTSDRTLVLSSGIHGVEGFFGSAVQLDVLEDWARHHGPPPGVRCVLLHALNPFGFAWRRRVNESNVDLNRNLLREGEAFAGSPEGYARLDRLLNPQRAPSRWEPVTLKMLLAIARYGLPALKQAVAAGQFDYPQGLFYGGDRPSRLSEVLSANFDAWLGGSGHVMHLDFHTGLGDRATCTLLIDHPLTEDGHRRLSSWFGPNSFEVAHSHGVAYRARGTFGQWCVARGRSADYLYATAEFGTYSPTEVLAGLRAENQVHHWCGSEDAPTERAKHRLVELFCPRSEDWRRRVLERGRELVAQATRGLSGG